MENKPTPPPAAETVIEGTEQTARVTPAFSPAPGTPQPAPNPGQSQDPAPPPKQEAPAHAPEPRRKSKPSGGWTYFGAEEDAED